MTPEEWSKLREAVGLLDSMVRCGEDHSERSEEVVAQARAVLRAHGPIAGHSDPTTPV